jgi:hypothetical protein
MQLRFASFVVTYLRRDFHPQECAHAGRTNAAIPAAAGWKPAFRESLSLLVNTIR